jgi:uncharacterized membrane protein YvbJ
MHCPQCGQQQISDETRFCSRCGFSFDRSSRGLLRIRGLVPEQKTGLTGKIRLPSTTRGSNTGVFLFLLVFLLAPLGGDVDDRT